MNTEKTFQDLDNMFKLFEQFGSAEYIGEPVSQIEHMSQTAQLAMQGEYDEEVVLAAFFHDIGHICVMKDDANDMEGFGVKSHEKIGADYLRSTGFPERIARLVENHVQAKRYLTFANPEYYSALSEASKRTLEFQGGIMTEQEAAEFRQDPLFELSIKMRQWDEQAKKVNAPLVDLALMKEKAKLVLLEHHKRDK